VVPNPAPPRARPRAARAVEAAEQSADPVERVRRRNEHAAQAAPPPQESCLIYRALRAEMGRRAVDLPILAPAYAHGVWTDADLMQTMLLAPEVARRHFALATRNALVWIERYLAIGIDQIGIGGDFAGNRLLISQTAYRHFIVPHVRRLARRIHTAKRYAVNASDGNLWPVLDDFLFGCEVDGYLEIDQQAGMDLRALKSICRGRVALYGNLDCGNLLSFGSPATVRRQTLDCLEAGLGQGGHILCASNAITASVPLNNYLAMVNAYREYCGLTPFKAD